jgi:hypothetical protein
MPSRFRLRRRDARWLMFPVMVVLVGVLAVGLVAVVPH